jgi:hypothetical protein
MLIMLEELSSLLVSEALLHNRVGRLAPVHACDTLILGQLNHGTIIGRADAQRLFLVGFAV